MKVEILRLLFTVFIYRHWDPLHVFCLWFVYCLSLRIISSQKTRLFGKSCLDLSFLHVSWSVSVCDSQWSLIITREGRLQKNRGVRLRRGPVWSRPLRFSCVPAKGLKSSDGIRANKETWLSVCHQRMWAKKCGFIFFPRFEVSVLNGMKDALDPVPIIKLQSMKPERRVYLSWPPKAEQRVFEWIL